MKTTLKPQIDVKQFGELADRFFGSGIASLKDVDKKISEIDMLSINMLLNNFNRGFHSQEKVNILDDMIVYTTPRPFKACDDARIRIAEMGLPLQARVTNSITFIVEPCK